MNKKNKNGFTLVELLAVIVILAIIVLIAITTISDRVEKSNAKTLMVNADSYVKAVNNMASMSIREQVKYEEGVYNVSDFSKDDIKISGTFPTSGYFVLSDYEVVDACLVYGNYAVKFKNAVASSVEEDGKCEYSNN